MAIDAVNAYIADNTTGTTLDRAARAIKSAIVTSARRMNVTITEHEHQTASYKIRGRSPITDSHKSSIFA
jgi:hypothetical protein